MDKFTEPENAPVLKPSTLTCQVTLTLNMETGEMKLEGNFPNWYLVIGICEMGRVLAEHQAQKMIAQGSRVVLPGRLRGGDGI